MNINVKGIKIRNFKNIKELDIDFLANSSGLEMNVKQGYFKWVLNKKHGLPAYVALMGRNAIGKSSILSAFAWIGEILNNSISRLIATDIVMKEANRLTVNQGFNIVSPFHGIQELELKVVSEINNKKGMYYDLFIQLVNGFNHDMYDIFAQDKSKSITIQLELIVDENIRIVTLEQNKEKQAMSVESKDIKEKEQIIKYLSNIHVPEHSGLNHNIGTVFKDPRMHSNDDEALISHKISALIVNVGKTKTLKLLQLADPEIEDLHYKEISKGVIQLTNITINGLLKTVQELSTGTRHFILMSELILRANQKTNSIVLIDEIETNLHIELVNVLKLMMLKAFKNNVQFIFTTHNPLALQKFTNNKQVYAIDKEGDKHTYTKLSTICKQHESIVTKYEQGLLSMYPDTELARNRVSELFGDIDE